MKLKILNKIPTIGLFIIIFTSLFSILLEELILIAHLLVHFQLQYFIIALFFTFILFILKKWRIALIGILYLIIFYATLLHPINLYTKKIDSPDIFFLNAQYDNQNIQPITQIIKKLKPKTVSLVESNTTLVNELSKTQGLPIINHRAYASSCTVFSKKQVPSEVKGQTHLPICIIKYKNYDLLTVHVHRPINNAILQENINFFNNLTKIIESYEKNNSNFIIVGDFNSTIYSKIFRSRFKKYLQKSIYTWKINTPITLPIDHVISNMDVEVSRTKDLGSDHTGLLIKIKKPI